MNLKLIPIIILSLLIGLGLGCIPIIKDHLHYNIWFFIPVSGLLFGAALGLFQYFMSYYLNCYIKGFSLFLLVLTSIISYFLIDFGIYLTTSIQIANNKSIPDGVYRLSELSTFLDYLKIRLGSSGIGFTFYPDASIINLGGAATKISYIIDFIGVCIASFFPFLHFSKKHPFCNSCKKYKNSKKSFQAIISPKSTVLNDTLSRLQEYLQSSSLIEALSYLEELHEKYSNNKGDMRLMLDQRVCSGCDETTIVCRIYQKDTYGNWKSSKDFNFTFNKINEA